MSAMEGTLPMTDSLADQAERWIHSPAGRHVMRDLYALAATYAKTWKRTGIPISMKLLFEIERQRIKTVTARAQARGIRIGKDAGYSINNSRSAYVARHMVMRKPEWNGLFEMREVKEGIS